MDIVNEYVKEYHQILPYLSEYIIGTSVVSCFFFIYFLNKSLVQTFNVVSFLLC